MRCLVTAGPTHEAVDLVRRLTNFSTGQLGTDLATHLAALGHQVVLLRGVSASAPPPPASVQVESFSSVMDLGSRFLEHADEGPMAIFHAAAVSDFVPGLMLERDPLGNLRAVYASKFSSRATNLLLELRRAPKLLAQLREWYPEALLVGWKYEVEGDRDQAVARGRQQLADCRTNLCVVNGPAYGEGFGLLRAGAEPEEVAGVADLHTALAGLLK